MEPREKVNRAESYVNPDAERDYSKIYEETCEENIDL